jgi:MFS family permease
VSATAGRAVPAIEGGVPARDRHGRSRVTGLLALTIVAGFASSIFLSLSVLLVDRYGWRTALVILALICGVAVILPAPVGRAPPRGVQLGSGSATCRRCPRMAAPLSKLTAAGLRPGR